MYLSSGNKGSNYEVGDTLKVLGSEMAGDDGANHRSGNTVATRFATTLKHSHYGIPNTIAAQTGNHTSVATDTNWGLAARSRYQRWR